MCHISAEFLKLPLRLRVYMRGPVFLMSMVDFILILILSLATSEGGGGCEGEKEVE